MRALAWSLSLLLVAACGGDPPPPAVGPGPGPGPVDPGPQPEPPIPLTPHGAITVIGRTAPPPPWIAAGTKDYTAQGGPGLGVSFRYEAPFGHADFYIYDGGEQGLRSGIDDPQARAQMGRTLMEVQMAKAAGAYTSAQVSAIRDIDLEGVKWLKATMQLGTRGGMLDSFTFLRVDHGHYLKFRVSMPAPADPRSIDAMHALVADRQRIVHRRFSQPPTPGGS